MTATFVAGLDSITDAVSTDAHDLAVASHDRSTFDAGRLPLAVVRPASVDEVQRIVRLAGEHRVPVVPRGAGTGLAGGATAGEGCLVLDTSRLDRILEIRVDDGLAVVQAGVITARLDAAVREHGLRYAPDPASVEISTIGGNIATNAGGLRCVKYGVTGDAVLGLDVVLADGTLVRTGRQTVKGVTGYDLTSLFVGSEGTLGVIVAATLSLDRAPTSTATAAAFFTTVDDAARAVLDITATGVRPSVLELIDDRTLAAIDAAHGGDLRSRGGAFLLVQTDGLAYGLEIDVVRGVLESRATQFEVTTDPETARELIATRRAALPSIERLGPVLIEDIAVPRSRLADAVRSIAEISQRTGVPIFTFAHAGDGNLHPIVLIEEPAHGADGSVAVPSAVTEAVGLIFQAALDLGGTLTAEHGIGVLKREYLSRELDESTHRLHRRIKQALDPGDILNPGKAI